MLGMKAPLDLLDHHCKGGGNMSVLAGLRLTIYGPFQQPTALSALARCAELSKQCFNFSFFIFYIITRVYSGIAVLPVI